MLSYHPLATDWVRAIRAGAPDANGQPAERAVSDGGGNPCRHCLKDIPRGAPMLILAARPFDSLQPYAETGPIFLCADDCAAHDPARVPEVLTNRPDYLLKGYARDDRIVYGTGAIVPATKVEACAAGLLARPDIAYIHVRSSRNNCYQLTIRRGEGTHGRTDTGRHSRDRA